VEIRYFAALKDAINVKRPLTSIKNGWSSSTL
jgi:hypothetical protein